MEQNHVFCKMVSCQSFSIYKEGVDRETLSPPTYLFSVQVLSLMMRKETAIKGTDINDKTFLLSQYADDTQIFLNGSETSLLATLGILKKFYLMSGL